MQRLKRRQDFLAAAKQLAQATPGFVLQARKRGDTGPARVGFTCSKRLGKAVTRNRIKRRLREAVRLSMPTIAQTSFDYIFIGRPAAAHLSFKKLQTDLISAVTRLNAKTVSQKMEVK